MDNVEIRDHLKKLIAEIEEHLGEGYAKEVVSYLLATTIRVWSGNKLCSEDYAKALEVFEEKKYTTAQIITALDCSGGEDRKIRVPGFFEKLVLKDAQEGTNYSRSIADSLCVFLSQMALINGDFTIEEARFLHEISDSLIDCCDTLEVLSGKSPEHHPEMITPMKKTGYYEKEEKVGEKPRKEDPVENTEETEVVKNDEESDDTTKDLLIGVLGSIVKNSLLENQENKDGGVTVNNHNDENENKDTLESVLAELNSLVGLDKVKTDVQSLMNFIKISKLRKERGMKTPTVSYHLVFTGNPGTGKTTVARLVAKLYYLLGILPQGQLVETDRSGLVAGYLGQTAIKTQKVISQALGGVLFIDEAYALANDDDDSYGKEAIETILKAMEDHRNELVVIVAGYDDLMHNFIDSNPGLRSRFNKYFHFPDYNGEELFKIFKRFCDSNGYDISEDAVPCLTEKLNEMFLNREEHFGNARAIRNLFEHAINHQANRLVVDNFITDAELAELTKEDISAALEVV